MTRLLSLALVFVCAFGLWSTNAYAQGAVQASIAGVVRDTSGAVLPGVTIEASSPVLIEKTRSTVTDTQGRYNLVDLRPGVYVATFTLSGFTPLRRENLTVSSNVNLPVNVELKIGGLEETLTVSGQAAVVDVRTAART